MFGVVLFSFLNLLDSSMCFPMYSMSYVVQVWFKNP